MKNQMRPIHPGEVLREEFLVPLELSANALAQAIGVPANRISTIVAGERNVTADTALRLARALGTTPEFWLNLQQSYELRLAEQDKEGAAALRGIRRLVTA
jgi:addiction module HigA family antidote